MFIYFHSALSSEIPEERLKQIPLLLNALENLKTVDWLSRKKHSAIIQTIRDIALIINQTKPLLKGLVCFEKQGFSSPLLLSFLPITDSKSLFSKEWAIQFSDLDSVLVGLWENSRLNGEGFYMCHHRLQYAGKWKHHCPEGEGIYFFENGDSCTGVFKKELEGFSGRGILRNSNGRVKYIGNFVRSQFEGLGTLFYFEEDSFVYEKSNSGKDILQEILNRTRGKVVYKGMFDKGRLHGEGTLYFLEKHQEIMDEKELRLRGRVLYEGQFFQGAIQGHGTLNYSNGDTYSGMFLNNSLAKEGTLTDSRGVILYRCQREGINNHFRIEDNRSYRIGMWHGKIVCNLNVGHVYEGTLFDGGKEKYGVVKDLFENVIYEGEWDNDHYHGKGTLYADPRYFKNFMNASKEKIAKAKGNVIYEGRWVFNQYEGRGTLYYENGDQYIGHFQQGKREGRGLLKNSKGQIIFSGKWKDDLYLKGALYEKGHIYSGNFLNNKKSGYGTLKTSSGKILYKGLWINDDPQDSCIVYHR